MGNGRVLGLHAYKASLVFAGDLIATKQGTAMGGTGIHAYRPQTCDRRLCLIYVIPFKSWRVHNYVLCSLSDALPSP